tara:strand:+ start:25 stop:432 length:408 start_codon:yes stop_codon:yes gene_type:complete
MKLDFDNFYFTDPEVLGTYLFYRRRSNEPPKRILFYTFLDFIPDLCECNKVQKQFIYNLARYFTENISQFMISRSVLNNLRTGNCIEGPYKGQTLSTKKAINKLRKTLDEKRMQIVFCIARKTICYRYIIDFLDY